MLAKRANACSDAQPERVPRRSAALAGAAVLFFCLGLALPALSQSDRNPSGLPLPRFASTRAEPINVRVGPGTRYDVAWVFVKSGLPVEIVQEFDTWRKVRDQEGDEGWIHQNLLSGQRIGLVTPWATDGQTPLRSGRSVETPVKAKLGPGFRVEILHCDGAWCEVAAHHAAADGKVATYSGYVEQAALWGVYSGESFDN